MLIPYRTDAPVYHTPYATIGLIIINVLVFGICLTDSLDWEDLALEYGHLNPIEWVTSNFAHAGVLHLLGNMIVLWAFGLVVEGKVGARRFLKIYLGIGVAQCVLEQLLMLGATEGMSLGSSSIIFGLIGIALIWAPKNHVDVLVWCIYGFTCTLTIEAAAYLFLGLQVFYQMFCMADGTFMTSMLLHLMGAAIGIPLGIHMLKTGQVDCEGWDWFSVRTPRSPLGRM